MQGSALLLTAAMAGCGSPPTHYYRLAAVRGAVRDIGAVTIGVRSISIPAFLDRNNIVKPSAGYEVDSFDGALWAEPLADMLQAVLVADLSQRLPAATVLSNGAIGQPAEMIVEIDVQRFDFDPDGEINLTAQIAVRTGSGAATGTAWTTRKFQSAAAPATADVSAIVAMMSSLWALAADQTAEMLI